MKEGSFRQGLCICKSSEEGRSTGLASPGERPIGLQWWSRSGSRRPTRRLLCKVGGDGGKDQGGSGQEREMMVQDIFAG